MDPLEAIEEKTSSDNEIEAPIVSEKISNKKEKKPRPPKTQKQMDNVAKMLAGKRKADAIRKIQKDIDDAEYKKLMEEKIAQKALILKARQLRKAKIIDDVVSEEEIDREELKKVTRARPRVIKETVYVQEEPRFRFI